jgi:hypothetical protein
LPTRDACALVQLLKHAAIFQQITLVDWPFCQNVYGHRAHCSEGALLPKNKPLQAYNLEKMVLEFS